MVIQLIPLERISERIVDHKVVVPVPQTSEGASLNVIPQERMQQRTAWRSGTCPPLRS